MAERELAFSTFLKLLELDGPHQLAALRGFLRGGGYNYWRPLQVLAPNVVSGELDLAGIQNSVGLMAKGHQRKYNEHALTVLLKWLSRRKIQVRRRPERLVKKFGNTGLHVRLEPEVAFAMDGREYLMHVWATNKPPLSEETLSMGLYYLRNHFHGELDRDVQFLIFDTVKNRLFSEISILENAPELLRAQRDQLSNLWAEVNSSSVPIPKKPGDDSRPGMPSDTSRPRA